MKITIFTTNTCTYCGMVKKFLDMKGKTYEVVDLDDHPERRAEAVEVSGGALTVPITVVEHPETANMLEMVKVVVGWNVGALAEAIN